MQASLKREFLQGNFFKCYEGYFGHFDASFIGYFRAKKRSKDSVATGDEGPVLTVRKAAWDLCLRN